MASPRPNLGEEIAQVVRSSILSGEFAPGRRINEVHLAKELGFSRTPVREALNLLTGEGFLICEPRRGFFVAGLSVEEVEDLYVVRALLDPEALRLAGIPSKQRIRELSRLNDEIASSPSAATGLLIELDDRWHRELIDGCPSALLKKLIEQHMARTRRYEHAYLSEGNNLVVATGEHREILRRLEERDLDGACMALRKNMESAREPLIAWLRQRSSRGKE